MECYSWLIVVVVSVVVCAGYTGYLAHRALNKFFGSNWY